LAQEYIDIRGARENNLKDVSLRIPKRKLTVFTGVSGSGKSSLVFATIAAESQRLINETYSAFLQGFMPSLARPEVDVLEGLTTAIIVDQKRMGANPRSTVGTATDANAMLRILFSRLGQPHIGSPNAFSFNVASISGTGAVTLERAGTTVKEKRSFSILGGMCPRCEGRGEVNDIDLTALYDDSKSIAEGAITIPGYKVDSWWTVGIYTASGFIDPDKPIRDFTKKELQDFLYKEPTKVKVKDVNLTYEGLIPKLQKSMFSKDRDALQPHIRAFVDRAATFSSCPDCGGTRLSEAARSSKIKSISIADACAMQISDLAEWVRGIDEPSVAPLLKSLQQILDSFVEIGLSYLSLDRRSGTLSGGEAQRVKMIRHLGSALTDVTYVFDEPSIGLHPRDVHRLNELLQKLRDKGNTVLVVEHDPDVIKVADHVVDIGPHAGTHGGTIVYEGSFTGLLDADTLTGRHVKQSTPIKESFRSPSGKLPIKNASVNNLDNVSVDIPVGVLTVVTGVAGSGKSSLIHQAFLRQHRDAVMIDQSSVNTNSRSNPATYTGILDEIRKAFATANKVDAGLFSFNSKGACENCQGLGVIYTDLAALGEVKTPCEVCEGKRFKDEVLEYKLNGKSISEVLGMTIEEALEFLDIKKVTSKLQAMNDVGLDYLTLGQPLSTLSGGECQRIKLASELHKKGSIYVMDEPTTGLHRSDIGKLLAIMNRLVDTGNTVIVIEHNLDVIKNADWIIDMGPEGGNKGGKVMFEGTPQQLLGAKESLTSQFLRGTAD
jgi:excinuclease UvrABC ATPase subunit